MLRFLILALFITLSTSPSSAFTLKQQISKGTFEYQGVKINPKPLEEIYKSNKYKGLWTSKKGLFGLKRGLTKDGKLLVKTLSSAADEGLNPNRYLANANIDKKQMKGKKIDQLELYLTAEFLKFARDIHIGIVDQSRLQADIFKTKKSLRRIIIGKTEHASPQFSDRMTYVEFNPQWNVPQSIAVNEYVPKLLKNSNYLKTRGYTLYENWNQNAKELDGRKVKWSKIDRENPKKFPYRIVQGEGPRNALGQVKFLFPNDHAIYLHDTENLLF